MFAPRCGLVFVAVCLAAAASGCGGGDVDHQEPERAIEQIRSGEPEKPVASVGAQSIGLATFQRHWDAAPETEAESVVEEVLRREVAAQRAIDAGLHRKDGLGRVRKRAMVRELLRREVEREVGPSDLDESEIEKAVEDLRSKLGRPAGIRATHLLVMPGSRESGKEQGKVGNESEREQARTWAERIRSELSGNPSVTELFEVRRRYLDRVPAKFQVVVDAHLRFPSPQARSSGGSLPDGWISVVDSFASKAHEMAEEGKLGRISEPVESPFGWHLIRPEKRLEAKIPDSEATREVAVSRRLRKRRRERFEKLWKNWRAQSSIALNPKALEKQKK